MIVTYITSIHVYMRKGCIATIQQQQQTITAINHTPYPPLLQSVRKLHFISATAFHFQDLIVLTVILAVIITLYPVVIAFRITYIFQEYNMHACIRLLQRPHPPINPIQLIGSSASLRFLPTYIHRPQRNYSLCKRLRRLSLYYHTHSHAQVNMCCTACVGTY